MLEKLRAWLNGGRDFEEGKRLYFCVGKNINLKALLVQGKSPLSEKKLLDELTAICNEMKAAEANNDVAVKQGATASPINNTALYEACLEEAKLAYKRAMNPRGELLRKAQQLSIADYNNEELVKDRGALAMATIEWYTEASLLFDRADYVKKHGKLPDEEYKQPTNTVAALHDCMVFYTLETMKKYYNKLKKKSTTPERVVQLQQYAADIKILEERWRLLKQQYSR